MTILSQSQSIEVVKAWKPNLYLTNMSIAYFMDQSDYVARKLFPICPVGLQSAMYYIFSKADLARDNVARKPQFGKVNPAIMGHTESSYICNVDQVIVGIDQLSALNYQRTNAPGAIDPRRTKVKFAMEQMNLHLDILFAEKYFKSGAWTNEWTGAATADSSTKKFLKFDDANSDPIDFIDKRMTEMKKNGRRRPNKIALGAETYIALKSNPTIKNRVTYGGSTANPAVVNTNVLAQLFGVDEVIVLESTYNKADLMQEEDMEFICDPKGMLMVYANPSPAIDTPSAGYIFGWDMLGDGNFIATDQYEGEKPIHSEFVESLIAPDLHIVCQDMATYFGNCCG
jgi:hypothetical protein